MQTIHAIYEDGVFRPVDEVDLPDRAEVEFAFRVVPSANGNRRSESVYDLLERSYDTDSPDLAARHNEHQP